MSYWESSPQSVEWYTPKWVFEALGVDFDLDVAPARHGTSYVPAARGCWSDGLLEPWSGFVWMNPPYAGRGTLAPWLRRFTSHANGIALVPDRTSAPWFQEAFVKCDLVLFTKKIRFLRPDGSEGVSPSNGSAFLAVGGLAMQALSRAYASGVGVLCKPEGVPT